MIKVIYCRDGEVVGDYNAYNFVDNKILEAKTKDSFTIKVANEVVFNIFALRVMDGTISEKNIEFYWENIKLHWDKYLGLELPDVNSELGVNLPVINKILKLGYQKRMDDIQSQKNKERNKSFWDALCFAANNMNGAEFKKWLSINNITHNIYAVEFGQKDESWELEFYYEDKLIVCCYDEQNLLLRSNISI